MYWLRLEDGVACLHGMGGSSHCCRHCWMALTEMEMILDWERGNHYAVVVVVAAVVEDVVGLAKVASGRIEAVQGSRRPRRLVQCCCRWIRSSREGHCLNKTKQDIQNAQKNSKFVKIRTISGRVEAVQDSRQPLHLLVQRCCQWIRSSLEGHCLNMPH